MRCFKALLFLLALGLLALVSTPSALAATFCANVSPYVIEVGNIEGESLADTICGSAQFYCELTKTTGPIIELQNPACDPNAGACVVQIRVPLEFPGNEQNIALSAGSPKPIIYYFNTEDPPPCNPTIPNTCQSSAFAACGQFGTPEFTKDFGETIIRRGGVSCANVESITDVVSLAIFTCTTNSTCRKRLDVPGLAFGGFAVGLNIGCAGTPPPQSCRNGGGASCRDCPAGGIGVNGSGPGIDGPSMPGDISPVSLGYTAGGVGGSGLPGSTGGDALKSAATGLGRYWTHAFSQRIVEDPDEGHVWLLTAAGTFHEFTDAGLDGFYETVSPSNEYRTLTYSGVTGWELADLDGTVHSFDLAGLWTETTDRNGNATAATYSSGELTQVDFPDGRAVTFTYSGGQLATITEVGVLAADTHVWTYTWTGSDLTQVDRPDGTAVEFFYEDMRWPGFITRIDLVGTSAGRRVLRAYQYDDQRRPIKTWRGDTDPLGMDTVDLFTFEYVSPNVTEITDSAGVINTRTYEEEPGSAAIRVTDISGACPTCGYGPDTDFEYTDPGNPLLPTAAIDAEGVETAMIYDANGRLVLRIEAVGLAEERTTTWQYDANFPAFPTVIEQPSVEPGELRTLTNVYDASTGDLLSRTQDGFEGGVALSGQTTVFTYDSSGQVSTLDPPGFGTTDQTVLHYDDPNLNGQIPTRRTDPLVGDSHLFYDPFNRRNATVDPNGMRVETDYDELDRVTAVRQCKVATPSDTCATPLGQVLSTSHAYNEFGDLAVTTLPRGNAISYSYDPVGRLIAIERKSDPLPGTHNERTFYTLDASGNRTQEEQQIWNGTGWTTLAQTSFEYQNRCQVQKVISGLPGEESITEYSRRMSR